MSAADTARMLAALDLDDRRFQAGIRRSLGGLGKLNKGFSNVGKIGRGFGKAAGIIGAGSAAALVVAAKSAIDYQEAFQGVVKTVEATPAQFDKISDALRRMSTEMPISAIELAGIAESAGAMGIKAKDIEAFTKQVAILATTTNVSADDAAIALGQLSTQIGLSASEFDNFAAALVDLGNKGNSTESQILDIEKRAGGFARSAGLAKEATLGWAAAAANIFGDRTEMGGTALGKFFNTSLSTIGAGGKGLKLFAKIAGQTSKQFQKSFAKDASGALQRFIKGLSKLSGAKRLAAIQQLFGKGTGIGKLVNDLASGVDKNLVPALDDASEAWFKGAAAQEEFNKRNATVRSALTRLKGGLIDAAVTIGEGFTPAIGRAADKLSTFLRDPGNRTALKSIGEDIGKAIDSIDWDKLLSAAKSLGAAFKPALDIVLKLAEMIAKLPPGVIGGAGAVILTDRLSGGAVTSAIGGIVGGLGESLAKSLASRIPLFGSAFVQPVFVTNMGVGGLGGGVPGAGGGGAGILGKGLKILGGVTVALGVAEIASIVDPVVKGIAFDIHKNLKLPDLKPPLPEWWPFGPKGTPTILPEIFGGNGLLGGEEGHFTKGRFDPLTGGDHKVDVTMAQKRLEAIGQKQDEARAAFEGAQHVLSGDLGAVKETARGGLERAAATTLSGTSGTTGAVNTAGSRIVGAIAANRPVVNVSTSTEVNVTSSGVQKATTTSTRYGDQNGSAGGGGNGGQVRKFE